MEKITFDEIVTTSNSGSCGAYTSYVSTASPTSVFTYPSQGSMYTSIDVYSNDVLQAGTYNFVVRRGLVDYAAYTGYSHEISFQVVLVDPCLTAVYSRPDISQTTYTYNTRDSQLTISFPAFTSSVVNALCGDFVYYVIDEAGQIISSEMLAFSSSARTLDVYQNGPIPSSCGSGTMPR